MSDAPGRGITVSELATLDQPVDVVPETTVAFVGRTLRGPLNTPVLVRNAGEFRRRFGDVSAPSTLAPAVDDFFGHGGQRLVVVRVANNARGAMLCLPASGSALVLRALEPGSTETLRAAVDYDGVRADDEFNLTLQRLDRDTGLLLDQECFARVSYREDSPRFVLDALLSSDMARVDRPLPTHRPESTVGLEHGVGVDYVEAAQDGFDGKELTDYDLIGSREDATGIFALERIDRIDILYLPPLSAARDAGPTAVLAAERYCRERGALLVVDPRAEWSDARAAVEGIRELGYSSPNMLTYFPRVRGDGADSDAAHPAGAAITGLLARLDRQYGPWASLHQPGLRLRHRYRAACAIDEEDRRLLERSGLNVLVGDGARRLGVCGDRTLARGSEPHRRQADLRVQRLCLGVIHAIDAATRWSVFAQPGPALKGRVEAQVYEAFDCLGEAGAFADTGFSVTCNIAPTPVAGPHAVELLLAFTPAGSREPVGLTVHQTVAGCRVTSTAFAPVSRPARPGVLAAPAPPAVA